MEVEYEDPSKLPPGFEFDPSDEELILHFLHRRASSVDNSHPSIIPDLDLCAINPCNLNGKAFCGCNKWYFYSKVLCNEGQVRETESGFWKLQDVEDESLIYSSAGGKKIGWKRFYVFHIGEPPLGIQTSWVLEEYHLQFHGTKQQLPADTERWVLCRVLEINDSFQHDQGMDEVELSSLDEVFLSLEEDDDQTL